MRNYDLKEDELRGFYDYPAIAVAEAQRGNRSWPEDARCPFGRADRKAAWQRGYDEAERVMREDEDEE